MTNYTCSDVMERYDETLLVCGRSGLPISQSSEWDAFISRRTGTGDSILTKIFGGNNEDVFSTIIPTTDSGYIAIGYTRSNNGDVWGNHGDADVWIVKFKKDTSTYVPTSISPDVSRFAMNEITVYPTLTKGSVQVNFPEGYDAAVIEVYNITGQRVPVKLSGGGSKRVVALDEVTGGQYILQVRNGEERKVFRVTLMP